MVSGRKNPPATAADVVRPPPARTLEGRQNQLINLAYDLVEERLLDKTATSQEATHFLKLGSTLAQLEEEQLRARVDLLQAQLEQAKSNVRLEAKYDEAIAAMRSYSGQDTQLPDEDEDYYD